MSSSTDHTAGAGAGATFTLGNDFPYAALTQPTDVGPYHIVEVVGEGGMGVVYKAEQREPVRRVVALKLIKLGMDTREVIARFESERQALAMMSHPNVAKVLDAGATESGRPYFVMEFVAGEPITAYCDKNHLTVRQRLELFTQACAALEHAHQKALIHRDVKPSNILVTRENDRPTVKVIDFGVAKATNQRLTERTVFTHRGQLIGTPEYMSPEQAEMSGVDVDTRTDIYSLGVVLYELLTGLLPFDAKSLRSAAFNEIQRIIREVDPPRPSTRVSTLGASAVEIAKRRQTQVESLSKQLKSELEWIPLKAMRKDPAQRYRTVSELASDVQNYLENRPLSAGPESVSYRARKFVRRNKGPVAAASAVLVVLVTGIIGTSVGFVRAERQRRDALAARDSTDAVNRFLTKDVIGSADPAVMRGRELTVREALGNAAAAIPTRFSGQPLTEASVRLSVALAYQSLGRADLGLPHALAAVEARRRQLGDDHPDTLQARHVLGIMHLSQSRWSDAERTYEDVVAARTRVLGPTHPLTLESRHNLACVYEGQSKLDEAARIFRDVLDQRSGALGPGDENTISTLGALALVLSDQGKLDEADKLYRDALARARAARGDDHPQTLNVTLNYASHLADQGRLAEAETLYAENLPTFRRVLGDDHHTTQTFVNGYAAVLHNLHKLDDAERLARDTLDRARRTSIPDHHNTLYALNNLATLLQERGNLAEAEKLFREALDGYRRSLGNEHGATLVLINNLAGVLHARGNSAEAEKLFREAVDAQGRTLGADHPDTLASANNHALALHALGRSKDAEDELRRTLDASRRTLGENHINTIGTLNSLAMVLKDQGNFADAEPMYRAALEASRAAFGDEHPNTLLFRVNLAKLLHARRDFAQAEPMLVAAMASLRKVRGEDHPHTLRAMQSLVVLRIDNGHPADAEPLAAELYQRAPRVQLPPEQVAVATAWYGPCLTKLGKHKEAEAPLRDAYQRLSDTDQRAGTPMRLVLSGLTDVCEQTGRADEAAKWRAELRAMPATQPTTSPTTQSATMPAAAAAAAAAPS